LTNEDFKRLFDSQFDSVRRYILYRSGDADVATDLAQETFLAVWEKRGKVDIKSSKGLLFKIANDLFISVCRKEKLQFEFFKNYTFRFDGHSPEEILVFEQLKSDYEKALKKMPEKQRTVFLMNRAEGLKYHEIAAQSGITVKAVEKRMKLALEFLKHALNPNE